MYTFYLTYHLLFYIRDGSSSFPHLHLTVRSNLSLSDAKMLVHPPHRVRCQKCNKSFANSNSLGNHERNFHEDNDSDTSTDVLSDEEIATLSKTPKATTLDCPQCDRSFKDRTTLANHKKFFHKKKGKLSKAKNEVIFHEDQSSCDSDMETDSEIDTGSEKDTESDTDSEESNSNDSCIETDDDDDMETDSKSEIVSNHPPVNPKIKRLYQSRAVKKIFKKQNMTPERMGKALKMCSDMDCIEIDEYLKVFEMMRENKIDEIIENNKYLKVIHVLFNGLKEGWIPICGLHLVKLDVHTDDAGKSMFELIDKFKNDLSKKKMVALISKNRELICDTFDRFTEPMMHYIELRKNYLTGFQARFEQDRDFRERVLKKTIKDD